MVFSDPLPYLGLGLVVAGQAAGAPLPGETGLIAAAIVASRGRLDIVSVILVAQVAAIAGGFTGYFIGWTVGRPVLGTAHGRHRHIAALIDAGDGFFRRHGAKAVFLARWVSGVRIVASPLAGAHRMPTLPFAWWNVAGGVLWPASVGMIAYALGQRIAVLLGFAVLFLALMLVMSRRRRGTARRPGS
jgi:membrane protein DedA with SNARE-associated domain